jgi:hypothetical protein
VRTADLELAARCRAGDTDAFEELYRQHARRLYSLVVRMIGSAQDAASCPAFAANRRSAPGFTA